MTSSQPQDDIRVFDRPLLRRRRERAASGFRDYAFLKANIADGLVERLAEVNRTFGLSLDLGSHDGRLAEKLAAMVTGPVVRSDIAPAFLRSGPGLPVAADEEALPFADDSFDLIASCFSLHWTNDLPGVLIQARKALTPDGLFLAALPGGQTLSELRAAFMDAEAEVTGGVSPRVAPFADVRDGGDLLFRAGFAMPVADSEILTVTYDNAFALMRDLRGMGEANVTLERDTRPPPRRLFLRMAEIYQERFADADGRIPATFEIIYLTGWRPHPDQPVPKRPGSANARLAEALGTTETPVPGTRE